MKNILRLGLTIFGMLLLLAGAAITVFGLLFAVWTNPMTIGLKIMGAGVAIAALGVLLSILEYWLEIRDDARRRRLLHRPRHLR